MLCVHYHGNAKINDLVMLRNIMSAILPTVRTARACVDPHGQLTPDSHNIQPHHYLPPTHMNLEMNVRNADVSLQHLLENQIYLMYDMLPHTLLRPLGIKTL